ncbi:hypothetical protein [Haloferax sp. DFSO52]|uniref:hypothetical protein n=1 Tax=Haloferax sp. DFSO52 TaxID=3388505 RepID=UPI003A8C349E
MSNSVETEPKHVKRAIRTHGERVKRRELQQALSSFETNGTLTDAQRATLVKMATEIVDGVLSPTLTALDDSTVCEETVHTAIELYEIDDIDEPHELR